jgi:16S rRNA processing protein RimM
MNRWIAVGRVLRAHGLEGEVVIRRFGETEGVLAPGASLRFGEGTEAIRRTVLSSKPHGRDWIVTLEGLHDRDLADAIRGELLFVEEESLPDLPKGTYYRFQLVGLRVRTQAGEDLGRIEEVLETGANDVFVVRGEKGEILIPAVDSVLAEVDLGRGEMVIIPIPGLVPEGVGESGAGKAPGQGREKTP